MKINMAINLTPKPLANQTRVLI